MSQTEQPVDLPNQAPPKPDNPVASTVAAATTLIADAPPISDQDTLASDWRGLKWGVERSIRYHMRREGYFGVLHRVTAFVGVISGSAAAASFLQEKNEIAVGLTLLIAFFSGLDLVLGFSKMERTHYELRRRFFDLLGTLQVAPTAERLQVATCERFAIEKDEPPVFRALDLACHNELMRAKGKLKSNPIYAPHYYDLRWYQSLTKHLTKWESMA